jgi:hypothetical protein
MGFAANGCVADTQTCPGLIFIGMSHDVHRAVGLESPFDKVVLLEPALILGFMNSNATEVRQTGYIIHNLCELNTRHSLHFIL